MKIIEVDVDSLLLRAKANPLLTGVPDYVVRLMLVAGTTAHVYEQSLKFGFERQDLQMVAMQIHHLVHRELEAVGFEDYGYHHKLIEAVDEVLGDVMATEVEKDVARVAKAES